MAGDWIKFEVGTHDKPEVWAIASELEIDPDAVVGKLLRVWGWFDQHTESGNAPSVTKMLLDRLVGVTGFCQSVVNAGWMIEEGNSVSLPNFDRHNGKTAKNRAVTAKRVAAHKARQAESNDGGNDELTQEPLPKEEKRREEKSKKDIGAKTSRAHQLPDGFTPNDTNRKVAGEQGVSIHDELPQFIDYHKAKGSTMKDWHRAFNTWIRNASKFSGGKGKDQHQPARASRKEFTL